MLKAVFVIPWYGQDIPGGAEAECRRTAENLAARGLPVEVAATCLHGFGSSWEINHHPPGLREENGVLIRRFPVDGRDGRLFDHLNQRLLADGRLNRAEELAFLDNMVNSRALAAFIAAEEKALFLPIPYLFSTSWRTAVLRPDRTVPIACLHDEPYAYLSPLRRAYRRCRRIIFHTRPELELGRTAWSLEQDQALLLGEGVDTGESGDGGRFRAKYSLPGPFILYAGRRDATKNTPLLLEYFSQFKNRSRLAAGVKLVLIGNQPVNIPPDLKGVAVDLGFLDRRDKADAFAAADIFCQPSVNESFSIVMMEAWLNHTPVLVHGGCPVTRDHVERSGGGLFFNDHSEFIRAVDRLLAHRAEAEEMARAGRRYVLANYGWDTIVDRYVELLETWDNEPPRRRAADRRPVLRQVVAGLDPASFSSREALAIGRLVRRSGGESWVYARDFHPADRRLVRSLKLLRAETSPADAILWHFDPAHPAADSIGHALAGIGCPVVMRMDLFASAGPSRGGEIETDLIDRVASLASLALVTGNDDRVGQLPAGFDRVALVPPVAESDITGQSPGKYSTTEPVIASLDFLEPGRPVGDLLKAFHFLRRIDPAARLVLGVDQNDKIGITGLRAVLAKLGMLDSAGLRDWHGPDFWSGLGESGVVVSLSGGPGGKWVIAQAVLLGLPVLTGPTSPGLATFGGDGTWLAADNPAEAAEIISLVARTGPLREAVIDAQRKKLAALGLDQGWQRFKESLEEIEITIMREGGDN